MAIFSFDRVELFSNQSAFWLHYPKVPFLDFTLDTEPLATNVNTSRLLSFSASMSSQLLFPIAALLLSDLFRVLLAC